MSSLSIYGREVESEQLRKLVLLRRWFLLYGQAGAGKTVLMKSLMDEIPGMLYCPDCSSSQIVFRTLAAELLARRNRHVLQVCGARAPNAINDQSAVSIRGIVSAALGESSYWIVLDHLKSPSQSFAAAVKGVCTGSDTPLLAIARSSHMEDVGHLLPVFADRSDKYLLRNFDAEKAGRFALLRAQEMQLEATNKLEAIRKIVSYSKGSPGAIILMLQMAATPKYRAQEHIKLSPLYIDFRLRWGASHA